MPGPDGGLGLEGIDHVVLTMRDVAVTCASYAHVLSMQAITFGSGRKALRFGRCKVELYQAGHEIQPHVAHPCPVPRISAWLAPGRFKRSSTS